MSSVILELEFTFITSFYVNEYVFTVLSVLYVNVKDVFTIFTSFYAIT